MDTGMKKGDQWFAEAPVPHAVPTCSLTEVVAMREMINGDWKVILTEEIWWEDRKQLDADGYWSMVTCFENSKWRAI
jgi:hypothetical protein